MAQRQPDHAIHAPVHLLDHAARIPHPAGRSRICRKNRCWMRSLVSKTQPATPLRVFSRASVNMRSALVENRISLGEKVAFRKHAFVQRPGVFRHAQRGKHSQRLRQVDGVSARMADRQARALRGRSAPAKRIARNGGPPRWPGSARFRGRIATGKSRNLTRIQGVYSCGRSSKRLALNPKHRRARIGRAEHPKRNAQRPGRTARCVPRAFQKSAVAVRFAPQGIARTALHFA